MATLKISELLSTDIRTRSKADKIREAASGLQSPIILDFKEVTFISRSFADELCNIMDTGKFRLKGLSEFLNTMYNTVSSARGNKRQRNVENANVSTLKDFESLSEFFSSI